MTGHGLGIGPDGEPDTGSFKVLQHYNQCSIVRAVVIGKPCNGPTRARMRTMEHTPLFGLLLTLLSGGGLFGQSIDPRALPAAGGSGEVGGASLGWSVGQVGGSTFGQDVVYATGGVLQPEGVVLVLHLEVLLGGPFDTGSGLMLDGLRANGLIPGVEPYTSMGHGPVGLQELKDPGPAVLTAEGNDAIVDWLYIELRSASDMSHVVAARAAFVQRDGDVVDTDGVSGVRMNVLDGNYHIAIRHRNHLPVCTASPVDLVIGPNLFDLTDGVIPMHVQEAFMVRNGRYLLWPGDVNGDNAVKYTGAFNDRDIILSTIGGIVPTNNASGYLSSDVNLDGEVKYTGGRNDRDLILQTIGGVVPTTIRMQPLP